MQKDKKAIQRKMIREFWRKKKARSPGNMENESHPGQRRSAIQNSGRDSIKGNSNEEPKEVLKEESPETIHSLTEKTENRLKDSPPKPKREAYRRFFFV